MKSDMGVIANLVLGMIGAVGKLVPVMPWLTRDRPAPRVVQERITDEKRGLSVRLGNDALRVAITGAQARLPASSPFLGW